MMRSKEFSFSSVLTDELRGLLLELASERRIG
jgi:hypothetical protein